MTLPLTSWTITGAVHERPMKTLNQAPTYAKKLTSLNSEEMFPKHQIPTIYSFVSYQYSYFMFNEDINTLFQKQTT